MNTEPDPFRMIGLHKTWADRYTTLWLIIFVVLFGGIYAILDEAHAAAPDRTDMLILLAVIVLSTVIWQPGLGVARVHTLISGIDLEKLKEASPRAGK